jgi:hypothetical protein
VLDAEILPLAREKRLHGRQVVRDAVLALDPGLLAGVGQQHPALGLEGRTDVDAEIIDDPAALAVAADRSGHEIEVRDGGHRLGRPVA